MKNFFTAFITIGLLSSASAQTVIDTVSVGPGYANQVWYSLENNEQATQPGNNWDIAIAATSSQSNPLTTAIHFNFKVGTLYEIPGSSATNFATADTSGISTWTALYNSDTTWGAGAFNNTTFLGGFDYGWGSYNTVTHNVEPNRVFVIRYNTSPVSYKKLHIGLNAMAGIYTITYANLDNSNQQSQQISTSTYSSKNFVYFSLSTNTIIDREPAKTSWDLLFGQYQSFDYNPPYTVSGILNNHGIESVKVYPVNSPASFTNWGAQTFSQNISEIGYDWKTFSGGWTIEDSTVYFVKDVSGDMWKLIFTGFGGSSNGNFIFTKQKLSSVGLNETEDSIIIEVFPNPNDGEFTIAGIGTEAPFLLMVMDLTGREVYSEIIATGNGLFQRNIVLSGITSGVYLMNLIQGEKMISKKLVIR